MKKLTLVFMLSTLVYVCSAANLNQLDTLHDSIHLLRAEANEDSTTLDLTTKGDFANKPASAVQLKSMDDGTGHGGNQIEFFFCGGAAADKTFTYKIYAWKKTNGMARMAATGAGTLGTQAVVKYPNCPGATNSDTVATNKFWADTLTITRSNWPSAPSSTATIGNNEVASIKLDGCGYEWWYCEITNADGSTGTEAGNVSVYYAVY